MHCIGLEFHKKHKSLFLCIKRNIKLKPNYSNKCVIFRSFNNFHSNNHVEDQPNVFSFAKHLELSNVSLSQKELNELNEIQSFEEMKDIINDAHLWKRMKLTPITKVKVKKLLSISPIPISPSRQRFLLSPSIDKIQKNVSVSTFPFDIPAVDTDYHYALPYNICSSKFERIFGNLKDGKDCLIIGNDFKGKTTAMKEIQDIMIFKFNDILPLYIDLSSQKTRVRYDITKGIVHSLRSVCGYSEEHESMQKLSPQDLIKKLVNRCTMYGKKLILLIDHIEDITWTKRMDILIDLLDMPRIHGVSSTKPYSIAISGTETLYRELVLYNQNWEKFCMKEVWNPIFQLSHIKSLSEHIDLSKGKLDSNDIKRIKEITNGHPYYVNRVLHEISVSALNTSDPVNFAANKIVSQIHLNGMKGLDFDHVNAFEYMFSNNCFIPADGYLFESCAERLGWFIDFETSRGTVLSYSNPLVRETVILALCRRFLDGMNVSKEAIVRMVDYKSASSLFNGWIRFLSDSDAQENKTLLFLRYMRMIADVYGLELSHEWPVGRNVISVHATNNIYMNDKHRITFVGHRINDKERLIKKILIPEAEKSKKAGYTNCTIFVSGRGMKETIEMFGIELSILYDESLI